MAVSKAITLFNRRLSEEDLLLRIVLSITIMDWRATVLARWSTNRQRATTTVSHATVTGLQLRSEPDKAL